MDELKENEELIENLTNQLVEQFLTNIEILEKLTVLTEKFFDGNHSKFVSEKSAIIGNELGFKDESLTELKISAALHDLGKIGFNDTLLFKNVSEMEPNELKTYHKHPEIAYNVLKTNPHFSEIAKIILQHHEKLDGTGFPFHLTSEKIHPAAKIINVVDIYHIAIFKRRTSGKKNITTLQSINTASFLEGTKERFNNVMNYLYNKRGVQFEKKIVEILIEIETDERRKMGAKSVVRLPVNQIEAGMRVGDDYYTSYGMLIASRGEMLTNENIRALLRFAENGELPMKILVIV